MEPDIIIKTMCDAVYSYVAHAWLGNDVLMEADHRTREQRAQTARQWCMRREEGRLLVLYESGGSYMEYIQQRSSRLYLLRRLRFTGKSEAPRQCERSTLEAETASNMADLSGISS